MRHAFVLSLCSLTLPGWLCACSLLLDTQATSAGGPVASGGSAGVGGAQPVAGASGTAGAAAGDAGATDAGGSESAGRGPLSGGSGGTGDGGATDGGEPGLGGAGPGCDCVAPTPTCQNGQCTLRGPTMVKSSTFYIDSTEVTVAQYARFLDDAGRAPITQRPECEWNDSFEPGNGAPLPAAAASAPVTNIDFCDAAAFCEWAGERLCGNIAGGAVSPLEAANPQSSQWQLACAGPRGQAFPYGDSYQPGLCNDESGPKQLSDVGSYASCSGYYPELFDMVGNAQEWIDACEAKDDEKDGCLRIGGSALDSASCQDSSLARRDSFSAEVGFRCCSK